MNQPEINTNSESDQTNNQTMSTLENNKPLQENSTAFFPVSEGKLITLYILSFGLYGVYWFYKNWKLQQKSMDKKIYPVWRAIFSIFFTHSLFKRIAQQASHLEHKHQFNANALATFFVAAIVVSNIMERLSMNTSLLENITSNTVIISSLTLFFLSAYPLAKVQATVNRINNDMLGYLNHKYSLWNYVLIVFGLVFWLMVAMGLLTEYLGLVVQEKY